MVLLLQVQARWRPEYKNKGLTEGLSGVGYRGRQKKVRLPFVDSLGEQEVRVPGV